MQARSPFRAGLSSALRHRRLALVVWLGLVFAALPALFPLGALTQPFDDGPFRESVMKGWDGWAIISWLSFKAREVAILRPSVLFAFALSLAVQLFLAGGVVRTLLADVKRPVFRRVVAEGAALFRPSLWAYTRYVVTLIFWEGLLVGGVLWLLDKVKGSNAPPNGPLDAFGEVWTVVVGLLVFLNVTARFDLARVALARDDSPTARGAYRVAKERLRGARGGAVLVMLAWLVIGLAVQALFTNLGVAMNPRTDVGVFWLVVFRQLGFVVLAMTRIGFWSSLLAWEEARRPVALLSWQQPRPYGAETARAAAAAVPVASSAMPTEEAVDVPLGVEAAEPGAEPVPVSAPEPGPERAPVSAPEPGPEAGPEPALAPDPSPPRQDPPRDAV